LLQSHDLTLVLLQRKNDILSTLKRPLELPVPPSVTSAALRVFIRSLGMQCEDKDDGRVMVTAFNGTWAHSRAQRRKIAASGLDHEADPDAVVGVEAQAEAEELVFTLSFRLQKGLLRLDSIVSFDEKRFGMFYNMLVKHVKSGKT
jgi:hypothetical protein